MVKTTAKKIEIMRAYEEGKRIECNGGFGWKEWILPQEPVWDWGKNNYRVKEEPKFRPYENTEEMINDFCERSGAKRSKMGEPFIWVKLKNPALKELKIREMVVGVTTKEVAIGNGNEEYNMDELFETYTFLDGSPCGKEIK